MGKFQTRPGVGLTDNPGDASDGRNTWYGDRFVYPVGAGHFGAAGEGSYFSCTNATLATGIAGHAAPVVADTDTKALLHLFNGGERYIYVDHLTLEVTAAGTAGTIHYAVVYLDNSGVTARASGGTALTPKNCRSDQPFTSGATVYFGAVVTAMTNSAKVGQQIVKEVIPVVQDVVVHKFGGAEFGPRSSPVSGGADTDPNHIICYFPPVVVAPGGNLNIAHIRPSQSAAASYQVQFGYYER